MRLFVRAPKPWPPGRAPPAPPRPAGRSPRRAASASHDVQLCRAGVFNSSPKNDAACVYGGWYMVYSIQYMACGTQYMVHSTSYMVYSIWYIRIPQTMVSESGAVKLVMIETPAVRTLLQSNSEIQVQAYCCEDTKACFGGTARSKLAPLLKAVYRLPASSIMQRALCRLFGAKRTP